MDNFNLSQQQMDALLKLAGQRMGTDPAALRQQMQSGRVDGLLNGLPQDKQAQLGALMQNPAALEQLMQNPKVQQLLKGLMGK